MDDNATHATVTVFCHSTPYKVTGKIVQRGLKGLTVEDIGGRRAYATFDRVTDAPIAAMFNRHIPTPTTQPGQAPLF